MTLSNRGNTLITTLLMSSLLSGLILSLMSQVQLEMKALNALQQHMRERQVVQQALQSIENTLLTELECRSGSQCHLNVGDFEFKYQLIPKPLQCCLKIFAKQRIHASQFYQINLHLKEKAKRYQAQIAVAVEDCGLCDAQFSVINPGLQSLQSVID